ncbi:MAG: glycosyltransferase [Hyphomicrobiales bacterium]|nr:MAG: glycosyltransferase [Hyphomicrobiales bacterium]
MKQPIGYYVHHHGDGHRQRALAIAGAAPPGTFTLIGTGLAGRTEGLDCLDLPDDRLRADAQFQGLDEARHRPNALHYAPNHHAGVRKRVAMLTEWIEREQPALMVIDLSVEIAMLARLAATPTVYVRLGGLREDAAHLEAFRGAKALLAPFHPDLDDLETANWVRARTQFYPGLTRVGQVRGDERRDNILVVNGLGGSSATGEELADAARATPSSSWRVIGPGSPPAAMPNNLTLLGWVEDAAAEIAAAGIVVGAAGDGLVTAVIATSRPFICLPQQRPFDEQVSKARRLAALGAAIVVDDWPTASKWPALLASASALKPDSLTRLHDAKGARRAAEFLIATAQEGLLHAPD